MCVKGESQLCHNYDPASLVQQSSVFFLHVNTFFDDLLFLVLLESIVITALYCKGALTLVDQQMSNVLLSGTPLNVQ